MTQPAAATPGGSLQFERADRTGVTPGAKCAVCSQVITASYYVVNGNVTCQRCRTRITAEWNRSSAGGRFAKAVGLGLVAAALGAGLHFGIAALTGYEFGLVAVVVGLMVGGAVRKGSDGRGGRRYQLLAVFLTYTAVVVTDSSMIARELLKEEQVEASADAAAPDEGAANRETAGASAEPTRFQASTAGEQVGSVGPLAVVLGLMLVVALAYAAPVLIGITSPLHLLIAAFALYEAWKLNTGAPLNIAGPYQTARPAAA